MRRWWPVLTVAALLTLAGIAASTVQLPLSHVDEGAAAPPPPPTQAYSQPVKTVERVTGAPFTGGTTLPGWLTWALLALAIAIAAIAATWIVGKAVRSGSRFKRRAIRRSQPQREAAHAVATTDVEGEVVAAIEAGLAGLDEAHADARHVVIACWVRLEGAATATGTARQKGDTPTDLVLRLLGAHELSVDVLTEFADLYRLARYNTRRDVDAGMRDQARHALRQLLDELTGANA